VSDEGQVPDTGTSVPAARARHSEARRLAALDAAASALLARAGEPIRADAPIAGRTLLRPRWVLFHVITWALAGVMVWLGLWQLSVSDSKGFDLQNFGYWLQWWLFAACALFFWGRAVWLARRPPADRRTSGVVVAQSGAAATPGGAVVRAGAQAPVVPGEALLVAPSSTPDAPQVYRGYVIPTSGDRPVRSHGDSYHDSYNDYLWQIALADGELQEGPAE